MKFLLVGNFATLCVIVKKLMAMGHFLV